MFWMITWLILAMYMLAVGLSKMGRSDRRIPSTMTDEEELSWWEKYWGGGSSSRYPAVDRRSSAWNDDTFWGKSQKRVLDDIREALTPTPIEN